MFSPQKEPSGKARENPPAVENLTELPNLELIIYASKHFTYFNEVITKFDENLMVKP